jgi:histidinol-phosphate aminotransferase
VSDLHDAAAHGGSDSGPPIAIDFSTNAHPAGPHPWVAEQVSRADRSRYPDPQYTALREELAGFHRVSRRRIVVGASASELIWRLTQAWSRCDRAVVVTDQRTFGEYRRAAVSSGVPVVSAEGSRTRAPLVWHCNPDNPTGEIGDGKIATTLEWLRSRRGPRGMVAADLAYWSFRHLLGDRADLVPRAPWANQVVQLWTPNKLHGLTGVRGAYLVLPESAAHVDGKLLARQAPSWVLGADGVALLSAHTRPQARTFLLRTAAELKRWKRHQDHHLQEAGWQPQQSPLHFGLWRPPVPRVAQLTWHAHLRRKGIKLRDATSFGRPGWVRLVSRPPEDVEALIAFTNRYCRTLRASRARGREWR